MMTDTNHSMSGIALLCVTTVKHHSMHDLALLCMITVKRIQHA